MPKYIMWLFSRLHSIPWWMIGVFILFHMLTSWGLMYIFEPDAEYIQADTFWYFYAVTATTVGYGDFSPTTLGARVVGIGYMTIIGIATMGAVIGKIAGILSEISEKIRKGLMGLKIENHTIVVGDGSERTLVLLRNLLADNTVGQVVLVSSRGENPMNGRLAGFVSGQIELADTKERCCITKAKRILVIGERDTQVTGRAISVYRSTDTAEIVAFFESEEAAADLNESTSDRVRTVKSVDMSALVQEALDPGAAGFVEQLLDNSHGETYLCLPVPSEYQATFQETSNLLVQQRVNPLGLYIDGEIEMCPDPDTLIESGMVLAVAAKSRDRLASIIWKDAPQIAA